jgi:hypothetical protein
MAVTVGGAIVDRLIDRFSDSLVIGDSEIARFDLKSSIARLNREIVHRPITRQSVDRSFSQSAN